VANADVDPFYHDGGSTRGASLAATPPLALSYYRTTFLAHLQSKPDDSILFCSQNCWSLWCRYKCRLKGNR